MTTEAFPEIPAAVPFLECRLHPVTTRQFMRILAAAAKPSALSPQSVSQPVGQSASLSLPVSSIRNPQSAIRNSQSSALSPQHSALLVTYLNAHCSNLAARDAEYRAAVNRFGLVYADGQGVVWASRALGAPVPERVNAGDFIPDFCRLCASEGIRLFLLGSYQGVPERAAQTWSKAAPGLAVAGTRHGFFTPEEEESVAAAINAARPDILIVGMSAPRQELWTLRWAQRLHVPVIWCVGALFEYFSDTRPRAPVWMRRASLEWLFRLALEPRRLWRRYLVGNARFVWRVLRARRKQALGFRL
jgi:N-acetylglucosaminyldiphosphoundecaprenol N-acetyl-beta-D-mannosaminyltransferase